MSEDRVYHFILFQLIKTNVINCRSNLIEKDRDRGLR